MTVFADLPGAILQTGIRAPLRYGNPVAEQRVLQAGAEVLLDRGILRLSGPDRLRWLDSVTSQSVASLAPGESAETLILSPNGRIEHWLRLVDDGTSTWLIVDPEEADPLMEWLLRMRFMMQVDIDNVGDRYDVVGSSTTPREGIVWQDRWPSVLGGGVRYGGHVDWWQWSEAIVQRDAEAADDAKVAGTLAAEALRIAAGRPSMAEVDEQAIPHELDWLATAVHLAKGCYRGQETVAKVHNLGAPPRRLTLLHLDGSESTIPQAGDVVVDAEDRERGVVTAAAQHFELGPIALALLKRSVDPSEELVVVVSDAETGAVVRVAAAQEVLVPPQAGHANRPPKLPRLGAVRR